MKSKIFMTICFTLLIFLLIGCCVDGNSESAENQIKETNSNKSTEDSTIFEKDQNITDDSVLINGNVDTCFKLDSFLTQNHFYGFNYLHTFNRADKYDTIINLKAASVYSFNNNNHIKCIDFLNNSFADALDYMIINGKEFIFAKFIKSSTDVLFPTECYEIKFLSSEYVFFSFANAEQSGNDAIHYLALIELNDTGFDDNKVYIWSFIDSYNCPDIFLIGDFNLDNNLDYIKYTHFKSDTAYVYSIIGDTVIKSTDFFLVIEQKVNNYHLEYCVNMNMSRWW